MLRLCPRRMPIRPSVLATSLPSQQQQQPRQQQQTRSKASATGAEYEHQTPAFASPFKSTSERNDTTKIPSFANYMSTRGETSNKTFQYFMVGGMGLLTAAGAKATVQDFLVNMSASADVLAQAKVEVDLSAIPLGKNVSSTPVIPCIITRSHSIRTKVIIKWRGKPVFIRHRTPEEIKDAEDTKWETLRDPQPDSDRAKNPEWLIMLGVCTHLGCVPIGESGDYGGWFCPCHGSHYDVSGRARKGPAPLNLEVPLYDFADETNVVIG
ncbi:hsp70 nucleotide exchange factor fes1 [Peltigera leucophlebia]|nr:hsp70 nucleotide exchange factor fes1 [Peltigera leucophlebia]